MMQCWVVCVYYTRHDSVAVLPVQVPLLWTSHQRDVHLLPLCLLQEGPDKV